MQRLFRICYQKFPLESTEGSLLKPGRWHVQGQRVLYFAASLSLAILELRANGVSFHDIRENCHYGYVDIDLAAKNTEVVPDDFFGADGFPPKRKTQIFGSTWVQESRTLVLKMKSAVLSLENNYMVNTLHAEFAKVKVSHPARIKLDTRL